MKRINYRILLILFIVAIIISSALPNSSMLKFSLSNENGQGTLVEKYYSSFDPIILGNANFGPFLSSIIACVTIVLSILAIIFKKKSFDKVVLCVSIIGFIVSMFPYILSLITLYTVIISCLWLVTLITAVIISSNFNKLVID